MTQAPLVEGLDYYFNEAGLMVFTQHFLTKRGYCCESGCQHCPYGFSEKKNRQPNQTPTTPRK